MNNNSFLLFSDSFNSPYPPKSRICWPAQIQPSAFDKFGLISFLRIDTKRQIMPYYQENLYRNEPPAHICKLRIQTQTSTLMS